MAAVGAAALHVGIGGIFYVAVGGSVAVVAAVGTISMTPTVVEGALSVAAAAAIVIASMVASTTVIVASAGVAVVAASILAMRMVIVIQLSLEGGDRCGESRHLVEHILALLS